MWSSPVEAGAIVRRLAAVLIVVGAPALARGAERLEDIAEIARALPAGQEGARGPAELALRVAQAPDEVHRVEVPAAADKYDREAGIFHVRLLTSDARILAAMKVARRGAYRARTRDGYPFQISRQDVTLYELEVVEGRELVGDIAVPAPRNLAHDLMQGLVAVCEFRVVAGADGLPAYQSVESYQTSVTEPLDGRVTTHVVRVALASVTLRSAASGRVYRRIDANPVASAGAAGAAAGHGSELAGASR